MQKSSLQCFYCLLQSRQSEGNGDQWRHKHASSGTFRTVSDVSDCMCDRVGTVPFLLLPAHTTCPWHQMPKVHANQTSTAVLQAAGRCLRHLTGTTWLLTRCPMQPLGLPHTPLPLSGSASGSCRPMESAPRPWQSGPCRKDVRC